MAEPPDAARPRRVDLDAASYDARWRALAAAGQSVHGEADLVSTFAPARVLDAGCGTGRVAIELAARGVEVAGIDVDPALLGEARRKAPDLAWHLADLADGGWPGWDSLGLFDVVVMAGNVMIFVAPGTEAAVVANLAARLEPGGVLIAGFQTDRGYTADRYDADCASAGLERVARYATWEVAPATAGDRYAVSVHRRPG